MPNYIRNILKIESTPEKIEQLFKAIQSETDPEQLIVYNIINSIITIFPISRLRGLFGKF